MTVSLTISRGGTQSGRGKADFSWPDATYGTTRILGRDASVLRPTGWLDAAIAELGEVDQEAAEEGLSPTTEIAKRHARKILQSLAEYGGPAPAVYPTEERQVEIFFRNRENQSGILIVCEPDGAGAYFVTSDIRNNRSRTDDAGNLPDPSLTSAFLGLCR